MFDSVFFRRFCFPMRIKNLMNIAIFSGIIMLLFISIFESPRSFAKDSWSAVPIVTSVDLIEKSDKFDGEMVIYEGEVIDPILFVGNKAWLAINDDLYAKRPRRIFEELKGGNSGLTVLVDRKYAERIKFTGSYNSIGDRLRITGVFHESSPDFGGELMIEALSVKIVKRGFRINTHKFGRTPIVFAALSLLTFILLGLWLSQRAKAERTST